MHNGVSISPTHYQPHQTHNMQNLQPISTSFAGPDAFQHQQQPQRQHQQQWMGWRGARAPWVWKPEALREFWAKVVAELGDEGGPEDDRYVHPLPVLEEVQDPWEANGWRYY